MKKNYDQIIFKNIKNEQQLRWSDILLFNGQFRVGCSVECEPGQNHKRRVQVYVKRTCDCTKLNVMVTTEIVNHSDRPMARYVDKSEMVGSIIKGASILWASFLDNKSINRNQERNQFLGDEESVVIACKFELK